MLEIRIIKCEGDYTVIVLFIFASNADLDCSLNLKQIVDERLCSVHDETMPSSSFPYPSVWVGPSAHNGQHFNCLQSFLCPL